MSATCPFDYKASLFHPVHIPTVIVRLVGARHIGPISYSFSSKKVLASSHELLHEVVEVEPLETITKKVENITWKGIIYHFGIP